MAGLTGRCPVACVKMKNTPATLKPLPLWKSILLFACTTAPIYFGVYFLIPVLQNRGLSFLSSYLISFYPAFIVMFLMALILYSKEGNPLTWNSFADRYRLLPVRGRSWFWVAGLIVFGLAATVGLSSTGKWLASFQWFAPPVFFPPELNPLKDPVPGTFMGTPVHGQWGYALAYLVGWVFNILGEELLWRGYMLPRQEISYGKAAWIVHGLLWTGWHVFWKWNLISLLPVTLAIAFTAQRTKNTSIVIIAHGLVNFLPLVALVFYILA
jgi:membrane protease YdiL (CAAX protease family)